MPVIFRIRDRLRAALGPSNKRLPVHVTSAVELDERPSTSIGDRIGEQTGERDRAHQQVDPEILGGVVLRVGNFILDASIRNSLNQLRKQVAQA